MPLYLQLFHGRLDPTESMTDWGTEGPTLGPLDAVTTTYGGLSLLTQAGRVDLPFVDGLIFYDGACYGDTCTFEDSARDDAVLPDEARAELPRVASLRHVELPSVPVPREHLPDYLATVAAFCDVLLDLGGPPLARAALRALGRFIDGSSSRYPVTARAAE